MIELAINLEKLRFVAFDSEWRVDDHAGELKMNWKQYDGSGLEAIDSIVDDLNKPAKLTVPKLHVALIKLLHT